MALTLLQAMGLILGGKTFVRMLTVRHYEKEKSLTNEANMFTLRFTIQKGSSQKDLWTSHLPFVPQVKEFGCRSFSLLFDDIETEMCPADKQAFTSFAHAQVAITNAVYQHLGEPETFLFCPTGRPAVATSNWLQYWSRCTHLSPFSIFHACSVLTTSDYCAVMCTPTVSQSYYLHTVGEQLLPGIDILWTGEAALKQKWTCV